MKSLYGGIGEGTFEENGLQRFPKNSQWFCQCDTLWQCLIIHGWNGRCVKQQAMMTRQSRQSDRPRHQTTGENSVMITVCNMYFYVLLLYAFNDHFIIVMLEKNKKVINRVHLHRINFHISFLLKHLITRNSPCLLTSESDQIVYIKNFTILDF